MTNGSVDKMAVELIAIHPPFNLLRIGGNEEWLSICLVELFGQLARNPLRAKKDIGTCGSKVISLPHELRLD